MNPVVGDIFDFSVIKQPLSLSLGALMLEQGSLCTLSANRQPGSYGEIPVIRACPVLHTACPHPGPLTTTTRGPSWQAELYQCLASTSAADLKPRDSATPY